METMETIDARLARLGITVSEERQKRRESLSLAHDAGVDDATLRTLATADRMARRSTIVLPAGRYEGLSRGRGWCRQGRGNSATWGERVDGGYRVGPGRWAVGSTDGFRRKSEETWTVSSVRVGEETWTVAVRS